MILENKIEALNKHMLIEQLGEELEDQINEDIWYLLYIPLWQSRHAPFEAQASGYLNDTSSDSLIIDN